MHTSADNRPTVCAADLFHLHSKETGGLARVIIYDMWTLVLSCQPTYRQTHRQCAVPATHAVLTNAVILAVAWALKYL